jgi:hypothetical protein
VDGVKGVNNSLVVKWAGWGLYLALSDPADLRRIMHPEIGRK